MLAKIKFEYGFEKSVSDEVYEKIKLLIPDIKPKEDAWFHEYIVDLVELKNIYPHDIKVIQIYGVSSFQSDVRHLINKLDTFSNNGQFNSKCEVHIPGFGLLGVNEVVIENDCCTEHLQSMLNEGWRILAACPQTDQRRPDYILCRNNKPEF